MDIKDVLNESIEKFIERTPNYKEHKYIEIKGNEEICLIHEYRESPGEIIIYGYINAVSTKGRVGVLAYKMFLVDRVIRINDIGHYSYEEYYRRSIGSKMIEYLEEVVVMIGAKKIIGTLCPGATIDMENLIRFYVNNGFDVRDGYIYKSLN